MKEKTFLSVAAAGLLLGASWTSHAQPAPDPSPAGAPGEPAAIQAGTAVAPEGLPLAQNETPLVYDTIPLSNAAAAPIQTSATFPPPDRIEEVIVLARRVEENQQDVPIAITTLNADALARESISTPQDLQGRIPSLVMSTGAQTRTTEVPTIRGQGATFGGGSGVQIYLAEATLPADSTLSNVGGPGKFFDLENIQVLKGSQGTLFGRNTTGGALLLTPAKPKDEFSGYLTGSTGSYSANGLEGAVNIPVISDKLFMRISGQYVDREGFTKDVVSGQDYDNRHYWTARLGIIFRPVEIVENYLFGYYTHSDDNGTGTVMAAANSAGLNELLMSQLGLPPLPGGAPQLQPGCLIWDTLLAKDLTNRCGQKFADEQNARDPRHVQLSADPRDQIWTGGAIDHLRFELNEELSVRNILNYSFLEHTYRFDHDGSRAEWTDWVTPDDGRVADVGVLSEEIQLQGRYRNGLLAFTTGLYFEQQRPRGPESEQVRALYNDLYFSFHLVKQSLGPFAQATYDLGDLFDNLDGLKITAGARYSNDDTDGQSSSRQDAFGIPGDVVEHSARIKNSAITWTVGADYKVTPETLVYGKVSRGYKSGGFAITGVNPASLTFKPEFVLNYEIGEKADLSVGSMPVRLNAAAYYTDYANMQRNGVDVYSDPNSLSATPSLGAAIFNAGKAHIAGIELEGSVIPHRGVTLSANYAYTRAAYDEYKLVSGAAVKQLDCSGSYQPQGATIDLSCAPFLYTPRHQFSVTAIYDLPVDANLGGISGSITYAWTDTTYTSATTLPAAEPGAYLQAVGLLNASLSWSRIACSQFDLQFFGTNLLDKLYILSNDNVWTTLGYESHVYGEPRMIGARLRYQFDGYS